MRECTVLLCALCVWLLLVSVAVNSVENSPTSALRGAPSADGRTEHRCVFDEIQRLQSEETTTRIAEIRPKRAGVVDSDVHGGHRTSSDVYALLPSRSVHGEAVRITVTSAAPISTVPRPGYAPIRIAAFFADLDDATRYCTEPGQRVPDFQGGSAVCADTDVLTDAKKAVLIHEVVPAALMLHAERLMVETLAGSIIVPDYGTSRFCGSFTIPSAHRTTGVDDADMVVYVSAGPTSPGIIAWALSCSLISSGRPVVGVINVSPQYITNSSDTQRVLAHEVLHALGFSGGSFAASQMVGTVGSLRGKRHVAVVNSPTVLSYTRAQFNCSTAPGMEIEDEGATGTAGSHWKRRNAINEIMAGISSIGYYSALTIAAMQDLGFYQGVFEKAEPLDWGAGAGCDFLEEKCVENGVTKFPNMFCTQVGATGCSPDRRGLGYCSLISFPSSLEKAYQYFSDPRKGGSESLVDHCPLYTTYTSSMCTEPTGAADYAPGAFFSRSSRCLDAQYAKVKSVMGTQKGVCVNIQCDAATATYKVWFAGGREWVPCPVGEWIDPSLHSATLTFGAVQCAHYGAVCGLSDQQTDEVGFHNAAVFPVAWPHLGSLVGVLAFIAVLL